LGTTNFPKKEIQFVLRYIISFCPTRGVGEGEEGAGGVMEGEDM
jgi:hypothetical protein